jgi:hypothetical protein
MSTQVVATNVELELQIKELRDELCELKEVLNRTFTASGLSMEYHQAQLKAIPTKTILATIQEPKPEPKVQSAADYHEFIKGLQQDVKDLEK